MSQEEANQGDFGKRIEDDNRHPRRQELLDLLPAYSLDSTDVDETEFVKKELAAHPDVVGELAEYADVHRALLHSAEAREPSPELAANLRAALQDTMPVSSQSPSWWNRLLGSVSQPAWPRLAFAALVIALIVLNAVVLQRLGSLQKQNDLLALQLASQEEALALITDENAEVYTLSATDEGSAAHASVRWAPESRVAVLTAQDFPELQPNMAYQLWLIRDGQRTSGGLFSVDSQGGGVLLVVAAEPMDTFDSMGITPEPETGSPGPTSPPVVLGTL